MPFLRFDISGALEVESLCCRGFCSISAQGGLHNKEAHFFLPPFPSFLLLSFPPFSLPSHFPTSLLSYIANLYIGSGPLSSAELRETSHPCVGPAQVHFWQGTPGPSPDYFSEFLLEPLSLKIEMANLCCAFSLVKILSKKFTHINS